MDGVVCPIYEKGDKLDCSNYRGITLINAAYKIFSQILCRRLSPRAKRFVGPYQVGFSDKLTRLIKATLDRVMCHVRVSRELAETFESRQRLRQDDGLSCALFNIGFEGVVRRAGIDTSGSIFNKAVQFLEYADDIDIIARNQKTVKDIYTRLKAEARRI